MLWCLEDNVFKKNEFLVLYVDVIGMNCWFDFGKSHVFVFDSSEYLVSICTFASVTFFDSKFYVHQ